MRVRPPAVLGSLGTRLLVPLTITLTAVLAVSAFVSLRSIEERFTELMRADAGRCTGLVERATHDGMLLNRKDQVQTMIGRLAQGPSVAAIRIYDMGGVVTMSAFADEVGQRAALTQSPCVACHDDSHGPVPTTFMLQDRANRQPHRAVLRHLSVIANEPECAADGCHASPAMESKLGVLEVEVSMAPLEQTLAGARQQTWWTLVSLILVTGLVSIGLIHRLVLRPVDRLQEGTRRISRGELDSRIEVAGDDELGQLAHAFNDMAGELALARGELAGWSRKLEEKVLEKTDELNRTQRQVVHMERMASLGKLSATVAHELNNPIGSMLTYARLLERELAAGPGDAAEADLRLAPETRDELLSYARFLAQECSRCGSIVQNLLLFARRVDGAEMAPVDLAEVVERSLMLVRHHLEIRDVTLVRDLPAGDWRVVADGGQIEQAVVALLVNASEAMNGHGGHGGEITVRLRQAEGEVEITVSDNGVGIPPEVLPRIFEPFFSTKQTESGAGLGLAVVYGIVQRHGGHVDVESEPGQGTTFRLHLPRRPAAAPATDSPSLSPPTSSDEAGDAGPEA